MATTRYGSVKLIRLQVEELRKAIKAAEHRVHWTLRLQAWLKNLIGLGLRQ